MTLEVPTNETVNVKTEVLEVAQAASKEIIFTLFDFKNTVGYTVINTKDENGRILEQLFCKVTGNTYLSIIGKETTGGILAEIVLGEIAGFVIGMDTVNKDIIILEQHEFLMDIAQLTEKV